MADHDETKANAIDVAVLQEQMKGFRKDMADIKESQLHLDACMDETKAKVDTMYNSMKLFHSPKEWMTENWMAVLLIFIAFGILSSIPNAAANKFISLFVGNG